ncbi:MAG: hypothetical protein K2Y18_03425 [Alphaproteobacteria bacterium]|nr:hypothetical protein [Alphaproteobacteria bacterium]
MARLTVQKDELEKRQALHKEEIKALELKIKENDFYQQLSDMIYDRSISDEELAFQFLSICNVLHMDLDELSKGRKRLIEILIGVSLPREPRPESIPDPLPEDYITLNPTERFRFIGNDFTPLGLSWYGVPLKLKKCTHKGSSFEASYEQGVKEDASQRLKALNKSKK